MYKNGSTKFVYLDEFICTEGGYICLSEYIKANIYGEWSWEQIDAPCQGKEYPYFLFDNGVVSDIKGKILCYKPESIGNCITEDGSNLCKPLGL